jgi:hypothetical protein
MRAMYYQGGTPPGTLAFGPVAVGMVFVRGPQAPYDADPGFFTAGVSYTVTAITPGVPGQSKGTEAPTPWNTGTEVDTTGAPGDSVTFDTALACGSGIYTCSTQLLSNAYRVK